MSLRVFHVQLPGSIADADSPSASPRPAVPLSISTDAPGQDADIISPVTSPGGLKIASPTETASVLGHMKEQPFKHSAAADIAFGYKKKDAPDMKHIKQNCFPKTVTTINEKDDKTNFSPRIFTRSTPSLQAEPGCFERCFTRS